MSYMYVRRDQSQFTALAFEYRYVFQSLRELDLECLVTLIDLLRLIFCLINFCID